MSHTSIDAEKDTLVCLEMRFRQAPTIAVVLDGVKNEGFRSHANLGSEELGRFGLLLALATSLSVAGAREAARWRDLRHVVLNICRK